MAGQGAGFPSDGLHFPEPYEWRGGRYTVAFDILQAGDGIAECYGIAFFDS